MAPSVAGHQAGVGEHVVVHQKHHVTGGGLDAAPEGNHLAFRIDQDRTHRGKRLLELLEKRIRPVDVAVEHDDHLARGRVGRHRLKEGKQPLTASPRRHDHRDRGQRTRPAVSFVAWGAVSGRSSEIAAALGGEAHCRFPPESTWRPHAAVRYALCTLDTVAYLLRRRPRAIIVTNPPLVAGYVAWACARLLGCPVVLDSHPGGFGAQGDHVSAKLQGLHRWLARHVDGCAVASAPWVEVVESWGGRAVELHEAPPGALPASLGDLEERPGGPTERGLRVLCVGRLAPDEPSEEVAAAAALVPDCRFLVTGDPKRAPTLIERAPPNVTFTGYLAHDDYLRALQEADVVMTLTTEPSSVMRAAYEAVYAAPATDRHRLARRTSTVPSRRTRRQRRECDRRGRPQGP